MIRVRIPVWSRLTRPQRILLGVVALVVLLFVLSVGSGGNGSGANVARPPSFVGLLGSLFGGPSAVEAADLGGNCVAPGPTPSTGPGGPTASAGPSPRPDARRWVVPGSCALTVAGRDTDLRELRLTAADPIRVEAPVPRGDDTATKELAAGDELKVSVDSDGASITLTCLNGSSCAVEVG